MHIAENGMRLFATKSYNAEKLCFFGQKRIFQSKKSDVTVRDAGVLDFPWLTMGLTCG